MPRLLSGQQTPHLLSKKIILLSFQDFLFANNGSIGFLQEAKMEVDGSRKRWKVDPSCRSSFSESLPKAGCSTRWTLPRLFSGLPLVSIQCYIIDWWDLLLTRNSKPSNGWKNSIGYHSLWVTGSDCWGRVYPWLNRHNSGITKKQ